MSFTKYGTIFKILLDNMEYDATTYSFVITYNMLNLFLTLEGLRPSCMILYINDKTYNALRDFFIKNGIPIIKYTNGVYIVLNPNIDKKLVLNTISIIQNKKNPQHHNAIGKILGYLQPINIRSVRRKKNAFIKVYTECPECNNDGSVSMLPQRVDTATNIEIHEYYKPYMDILTKLYENPADFYFPIRLTQKPELEIINMNSTGGRFLGKSVPKRFLEKSVPKTRRHLKTMPKRFLEKSVPKTRRHLKL